MNPEVTEVIAGLRSATRAALDLLEALGEARADDDEWTRLPAAKGRCPVSNWSRSTILRRVAAGEVRAKARGGSRFYSLADVRKLLDDA